MIPNALEHYEAIVDDRHVALFLDYDGTLTPIVRRPELAVLTEEQRDVLKRLAQKIPVAIISGRDRKDVQALMGIEEICYAGSHGFDISGPGISFEKGEEFLLSLNRAEKELHDILGEIPGILIERKKYAIAIHFREVDPQKVPTIEEGVKEVQKGHADLRMATGKMIFELQPNIEWNKGKALKHLLHSMKLDREEVFPLYIGDDVTDEDAFLALKDHGMGIVVFDEPRETHARYALKNPDQVYQFFEKVLDGAK